MCLTFWHLTSWHLFDILTSFNLNHLSQSQGYFCLIQAPPNTPQVPPNTPPGIPHPGPPPSHHQTSPRSSLYFFIFRWFKFTLKPPYTITHGNLLSAIWDTSHWTSFIKFGPKTAWDISYDILWPILKYVNFWWLQGRSSNLPKKDAFRKSIFSQWRSNKALIRLGGFRWGGP